MALIPNTLDPILQPWIEHKNMLAKGNTRLTLSDFRATAWQRFSRTKRESLAAEIVDEVSRALNQDNRFLSIVTPRLTTNCVVHSMEAFSTRTHNALMRYGKSLIQQQTTIIIGDLMSLHSFGVRSLLDYLLVVEGHISCDVTCKKHAEPQAIRGVGRRPNHSPEDIARLEKVRTLYLELGSLEAAGNALGISRERVRQLLKKGISWGLYTRTDITLPDPSLDDIIEAYCEAGSLQGTVAVLRCRWDKLLRVLKRHELDEKSLRAMCSKRRSLAEYNTMVEALGHHPTATELQHVVKSGRALQARLVRYWGSMKRFRKEHGFPEVRLGNPNMAADTAAGRRRLRQELGILVGRDSHRKPVERRSHPGRTKEMCLRRYNEIVSELGHHPTATELQRQISDGASLSNRIRKLWGSLASFRRAIGVPVPANRTRRKRRALRRRRKRNAG